jgi:hypothetical protein
VNLSCNISDAIQRSDTLLPVVRQANDWLAEVVSDSPEPIAAEWSMIKRMSTGEVWVELHLIGRDPTKRFSGLFTPEELERRDFAESSFRSLFIALMNWTVTRLLTPSEEPAPVTVG